MFLLLANINKSKKGTEKMTAVYWFAILLVVAGAIAYMVFLFYGRPYDVRGAEENILTSQIADCLAKGGYLDEEIVAGLNRENFLDRCNLNFETEDTFDWRENDQYYAEISIYNFDAEFSEEYVGSRVIPEIVVGNSKLKPQPTGIKKNKRVINTIVVHHTVSGSVRSAVHTFKNNDQKSIHYIIDRDGTIVSKDNANDYIAGGEKGFVEEWQRAWHAGCGTSKPCHSYEEKPDPEKYEEDVGCCRVKLDSNGNWVEDFNSKSIGIELVNWGARCGDFSSCREIGVEIDGKIYQKYTDEQMISLADLIMEISSRYNIPFDREHLIGHKEVFEGTLCPGAFNWTRLMEDLEMRKNLDFSFGRSFYVLDRNNNQYVIEILTSVGKEEKNE